MSRALGGYVGHIPTPSTAAAPGVWTLREASRYRRAQTWPSPQLDLASISGLAVWLDASDASTLYDSTTGGSLVNADGTVARWEDKSGNSRHATQSSSVSRPVRKTTQLNGLAALQFDGSDDWMQIAQNTIGNGGNLSVFVVMRITSLSAGARAVLNKGDGATFPQTVWEMSASNPWYGFAAGGQWYASTGSSLSVPTTLLLSGRTENRTSQFIVNGANSGSASSQSPSVNDISQFIGIMGTGTSGSGNLAASVGELAIYDSALSPGDMASVSAYLMAKWGIA